MDAAPPPRDFKGLAGRLRRIRVNLDKAVTQLKSERGADYLDLWARPLVDVATDLYLSYLWLDMARDSRTKAVSARRFISRAVVRCEPMFRLITSGDRSTLDHFDVLVGPTFAEE
jgi:hypothetical protein